MHVPLVPILSVYVYVYVCVCVCVRVYVQVILKRLFLARRFRPPLSVAKIAR